MISQKEFISESLPKVGFRHKVLRRLYYGIAKMKLLIVPTIKIKKFQSYRDFVFLMIFNKKNFLYAKATIYSFLKNSKDLPKKIILVSDGTWTKEEGECYFKCFHNFDIEYESYQESIVFFKSQGEDKIVKWAQKHIWGKKYAAILRYSYNNLVLFSDPDVLWYKSPFSESDFSINEVLKLSIDNSHNYDDALINSLNIDNLYNEEPINCGIVMIKGRFETFHKFSVVKQAIDYEAKNAGPFAEQTIFAIEYLKYRNTWPSNEISSSISDMLQPFFQLNKYPSNFIARHYLFVLKWIYWKDFLTKI